MITQTGFKVPPVLLGHLPLLLFDLHKNVWLDSNVDRNSCLGWNPDKKSNLFNILEGLGQNWNHPQSFLILLVWQTIFVQDL